MRAKGCKSRWVATVTMYSGKIEVNSDQLLTLIIQRNRDAVCQSILLALAIALMEDILASTRSAEGVAAGVVERPGALLAAGGASARAFLHPVSAIGAPCDTGGAIPARAARWDGYGASKPGESCAERTKNSAA